MIQRLISHPAGRFARCRACSAEPRHICTSGTSSREPVAFAIVGSRHRIECRCGACTAYHASLDAAELEWGADYAQLTLPLRAARRQRAAA